MLPPVKHDAPEQATWAPPLPNSSETTDCLYTLSNLLCQQKLRLHFGLAGRTEKRGRSAE